MAQAIRPLLHINLELITTQTLATFNNLLVRACKDALFFDNPSIL